MPAGDTPFTHYQGQHIRWTFTYSDLNVPTTADTWTLMLVIAEDDGEAALIEVAMDFVDATHWLAEFDLDLDAGAYVYGVKRVDAGEEAQMGQAALTVLRSINVQVAA